MRAAIFGRARAETACTNISDMATNMLHRDIESSLNAAGVFFQLQTAGGSFADMPVESTSNFAQTECIAGCQRIDALPAL